MATGLLVLSAISAVGSVLQRRKISREQRKQNEVQNRIAAISRSRDIRRSIAASRIRTAEAQSMGFQLGVAGGTAQLGAEAGILSDTASGIGAANLQFTGQEALVASQNRISGLQSSAQSLSSLSSLTGTLAQPQNFAAVQSLVG